MPDPVKNELAKIQEAVRKCDASNTAPTVAHVCKFTSVHRSSVTDPDLPPVSVDADAGSSNMIMGIARVLSGTLRAEDAEYFTFGPRYDYKDGNDVPKQRIRCFLLMGSSFVKVDSVPAGHICAIYNLEQLQLKTVTLCDRVECMPLRGFDFGLQPLVKVNVEPVLASGKFEFSLQLRYLLNSFTNGLEKWYIMLRDRDIRERPTEVIISRCIS
jgi:ribosome assembly protein 1